MTATYYTPHPGDKRLSSSPWSAMLWRAAGAAGVQFAWDGDCYQTYRLTKDARPMDVRRWEAPTALSSLCCAVRSHETLAGDPTYRWLLLHVALAYVAALAEERRL